ncbi:MAG: hypothetical protein WAS36_00295 [Candidatus Saccharimonadales bacterium]
MLKRIHINIISFTLALLVSTLAGGVVLAQQSQSSQYQVNEVFFGTGGELNACSGSYCAKQSAGELTVGNTKSGNYQAQAGFNTDREPYIESTLVGSGDIDLGVLTSATTKTGTAQFKVKAYLTSGYVVQIVGATPTNGSESLNAMSSTTSQVGTEQFGLNLTANNVATASPTTFGADPVQDPDYPSDPFAFGTVNTDYDNPNTFTYTSGDIIASAAESSSFTIYTLSYIANISDVTPGGTYTTSHSLVATATF